MKIYIGFICIALLVVFQAVGVGTVGNVAPNLVGVYLPKMRKESEM